MWMEWIPLKIRPPKNSGDYIVTMKTGYWLEQILKSFNVPDADGYYTGTLYYNADENIWVDETGDERIVTAWMNFPEPYEEGS